MLDDGQRGGRHRAMQPAPCTCNQTSLLNGVPLVGMLMTGSVGAVYRAMLESLRMLSVWALDLLIWYTLDGEDRRYVQVWVLAVSQRSLC